MAAQALAERFVETHDAIGCLVRQDDRPAVPRQSLRRSHLIIPPPLPIAARSESINQERMSARP
jgi:hypothetical protein